MSEPVTPSGLIDLIAKALELEALGEIRERLLDLLKVPSQLFRVHLELVPAPTPQYRLSLELSDGGRNLAAALGAFEVNDLIVEQALRHPDFSCVSQQGENAESEAGNSLFPTRTGGAA